MFMATHGRRVTVAASLTILVALAAGCAAPPKSTLPRPATVAVPRTPQRAQTPQQSPGVVSLAREYLGTPYRYGGASSKGMDCSGLVVKVFSRAGYQMPRTSASQYRVGERIERAQLVPGDLVFFVNNNGNVNHVGIYAGDDRFIHASTGKRVVRFDSLNTKYFRTRYAGARRIVPSAR
jgi:cell wall-associated NlpC family hydrolase